MLPVSQGGRILRILVAADGGCAVDADHVGAHVGEQHRGEGTRPDTGELDDPDTLEGTHGNVLSLATRLPTGP